MVSGRDFTIGWDEPDNASRLIDGTYLLNKVREKMHEMRVDSVGTLFRVIGLSRSESILFSMWIKKKEVGVKTCKLKRFCNALGIPYDEEELEL